jgi:hypothetical protein
MGLCERGIFSQDTLICFGGGIRRKKTKGLNGVAPLRGSKRVVIAFTHHKKARPAAMLGRFFSYEEPVFIFRIE